MKVVFKTSAQTILAEFNSTLTAKEIIQHLPIESNVSLWGDEIYFNLGFKACAQSSTMDVKAGDIAYWPQGKCLCIFFGPTPQSSNQKPVPASPVVIVGKTEAKTADLRKVQLGEKITVSLVEEP